jgi:hypothetical protein
MDRDETTNIIDYPLNKNGSLVTRRSGLSRMKPRLNAPPENQPGSVDWTMNHLFGSRQKAIEMIESLVAGQGENADEKWVRVILLYKQWQIQFSKGELPEPPTLNQVCHSLNFDAGVFLGELQMGIQSLMTKMAHIKASIVAPQIVDNLTQKALSEEADVKQMELALKIGGVIDEKGGLNVQINNNNNNIMLKSEKEKMKSPLLQFSDTVIDIDDEARRESE